MIYYILKVIARKILTTDMYGYLRKWRWYYRYKKAPVVNYACKDNLCYLTICKAACSSIKMTFTKEKLAHPRDIHDNTQFKLFKTHEEAEGKYRITFVRNPFDRVYSCYKNFFIDTEFHGGAHEKILFNEGFISKRLYLGLIRFDKKDSFATFLQKLALIPDDFPEGHILPQHYTIYYKGQCMVDFIGRFENLQEDFEPIRKKYQLEKLPHINKTQARPDEYKDHYTKELADLVYKRYKRDFELWYPHAYGELMAYLDKKENAKINSGGGTPT